MSRLQDELHRREAVPPMRTPAEEAVLLRYQDRVTKFQALMKNKDFAEYLKFEAEMNDPKIVIAYKCTDPTCESVKQKIRDYWNRLRVLEKVKTNGHATGRT